MAPKTRLNTSTQISLVFDTGKRFLVSELPTNRDVIRYGILLRVDCATSQNYATSPHIGMGRLYILQLQLLQQHLLM